MAFFVIGWLFVRGLVGLVVVVMLVMLRSSLPSNFCTSMMLSCYFVFVLYVLIGINDKLAKLFFEFGFVHVPLYEIDPKMYPMNVIEGFGSPLAGSNDVIHTCPFADS
jgi:F0F1-type ATP synthase membrane subunit a